MERVSIVVLAIAIAEFFGLLAFASNTEVLNRQVQNLSMHLAFAHSYAFAQEHDLLTHWDDCTWSAGLQTCTSLKAGRAVKFHCDADGCHFDCGAAP